MENEYQRQYQYFENNLKVRDAIEARRARVERSLAVARAEYARAAGEAEPLLQRIDQMDKNVSPIADEEVIQQIIRNELRDYVKFRFLGEQLDSFQRKMYGQISDEARNVVIREMKDYTHVSQHERLVDQVRGLSSRTRQSTAPPVAPDSSQEVDSKFAAQAKELENVKGELTNLSNLQSLQMSELKDQLQNIQEDLLRLLKRIEMPPETKSDDYTKVRPCSMDLIPQVEFALQKAQEIINDQYNAINDIRSQIEVLLEGIRILNERVEEYDRRLEGVQTSMDKLVSEVQAENSKRHGVLGQAFERLQDKLTSEIAAAKAALPASPASAFNSPLSMPNTNSNMLNTSPAVLAMLNQQVDQLGKLINDIQARLSVCQTQIAGLNAQNAPIVRIPSQVQRFCDDVSRSMLEYQTKEKRLSDQLGKMEFTVSTISQALQKHIKNSDNNFKETAIHMDSVKKRFAEHRKQLEHLIMALKELERVEDQVTGKYESLREFLSTKIVPVLGTIQKAFPELFESGAATNPSRAQSAGAVSSSQQRSQIQAVIMPRASGVDEGAPSMVGTHQGPIQL